MEDKNIDYELLEKCKAKIGKEEEYKDEKIENISCIVEEDLSLEEKERYEKIGAEIISNGGYAVVTMAGGQRNKTRT